jgi:hypothetical protein
MPQFQLKAGVPTSRVRLKTVSGERKNQSRKDIVDLAEAIIDNVSGWDTLETAKADIMGCIETLESSLALKRIQIIVENIATLDELIKYCYNLRLRVEGLSVHIILRRKD